MTINERVQKIIDELYSGNKRAFSSAVGISPNVTENIVGKRKGSPSFDVTNKIVYSIENINAEWFITGEGEMLKPEVSRHENMQGVVSESQPKYGRELLSTKPFIESVYDVKPVADSFSLAISSGQCKAIGIPVNDYDFSLRCHGNSMVNPVNPEKSIYDQDIVACRLRKSDTHIRWGEVYALATSEGYIIKKVLLSDREGYICCFSFNENDGYKPYELALTEIFDWAMVVASVRVTIW